MFGCRIYCDGGVVRNCGGVQTRQRADSDAGGCGAGEVGDGGAVSRRAASCAWMRSWWPGRAASRSRAFRLAAWRRRGRKDLRGSRW